MEKQRVQRILDEQPEEVDVNSFLEQLHLLDKIDRAEQELASGKGIPHAVVERLARSKEK